MTTRRRSIIAIGAAFLQWPLLTMLATGVFAPWRVTAHAQPRVARIGVLTDSTPSVMQTSRIETFRTGFRELGYVEGRNLQIEWRFGNRDAERLAKFAAELAHLKPHVLIAISTPATRALQKAISTVPIVMVGIGNPVGSGFAKSLARPGGNLTGLTTISGDVNPKQIDVLSGMVPRLSRAGALANPDNSSNLQTLKEIVAVAQKRNIAILPVEIRRLQEIESAFAVLAQQNAQAVIVLTNALTSESLGVVAEAALKSKLPSIHARSEYAAAGGLMSYGTNIDEMFRRAATYVDKILKGANPADLPIEQPAKFELVINMKTAKALGITIPKSVLLQASRVIE